MYAPILFKVQALKCTYLWGRYNLPKVQNFVICILTITSCKPPAAMKTALVVDDSHSELGLKTTFGIALELSFLHFHQITNGPANGFVLCIATNKKLVTFLF